MGELPIYIEPTSEMRVAALQLRGVFNSFIEAGFSEDQATEFCITLMQRD